MAPVMRVVDMNGRGRQRGAFLPLAMLVLLAVMSAGVLGRLQSDRAAQPARETEIQRALMAAKAHLMALAVTHPVAPGTLPYPDRAADGRFDGKSDCVTRAPRASHLLGRFPWAGEDRPCPVREAGAEHVRSLDEALWYAVSRNVVYFARRGAIHPDATHAAAPHPWLTVREPNGRVLTTPDGRPLPVAAVIMHPGRALAHQDRRAYLADADQFLDRMVRDGKTYSNADADGCPDDESSCGAVAGEDFILPPDAADTRHGGFNDRLVFITVAELVHAVEARALGEAQAGLRRFRERSASRNPWLAPFRSPRQPSEATPADATLPWPRSELRPIGRQGNPQGVLPGVLPGAHRGVLRGELQVDRQGLLVVHRPEQVFETAFDASWTIDGGREQTGVFGPVPLLPPPPEVVRLGRAEIHQAAGSCRWRGYATVDCRGSRRLSLGNGVERRLEVSLRFDVSRRSGVRGVRGDKGVSVIPPSSTDPRRRRLTLAGRLPVISSSVTSSVPAADWIIRVTDVSGANGGWRTLTPDARTVGRVSISGIRYALDVPQELPAWFVEAGWHRFIALVSVEEDEGDRLLVSPGVALWPWQNRTRPTACPNRPIDWCDYFELEFRHGPVGVPGTLPGTLPGAPPGGNGSAARHATVPASERFNDRWRVITPR